VRVRGCRQRLGLSMDAGAVCEGLGDSLRATAKKAGGAQLGKIVPIGGAMVGSHWHSVQESRQLTTRRPFDADPLHAFSSSYLSQFLCYRVYIAFSQQYGGSNYGHLARRTFEYSARRTPDVLAGGKCFGQVWR